MNRSWYPFLAFGSTGELSATWYSMRSEGEETSAGATELDIINMSGLEGCRTETWP